jgi:cell division protein FtsB
MALGVPLKLQKLKSMPDQTQLAPKPIPLLERWWSQYLTNRRRIGTVAAVVFALFLAWHAVNGRNGLNSWQQKRAEDKALAQEIDRLTQENARLGEHVDRLKSDPGAIEHEARERLHYARPNEIIYALPATSQPQKSPSAPK